jgi:hypothetical protein
MSEGSSERQPIPERANQHREIAEAYRERAAATSDDASRRIYLNLVTTYEAMAEELDLLANRIAAIDQQTMRILHRNNRSTVLSH